jgi:hypothetical protein
MSMRRERRKAPPPSREERNVFYGLSAFFADLLVIIGPLLIVGVEAHRLSDWLARRRLDPLRAAIPAPAGDAATPINTTGLLDGTNTERIRMSEWLRGELKATAPASPAAKAVGSDRVLVGGGSSAEEQVRGSGSDPRTGAIRTGVNR